MHKVKLIRVESNHTRLRTADVEGYCLRLPKPGKTFRLFSTALDEVLKDNPKAFRWVRTSEVVSARRNKKTGEVLFSTLNSVYRLERLGEEDVDLPPFTKMMLEEGD